VGLFLIAIGFAQKSFALQVVIDLVRHDLADFSKAGDSIRYRHHGMLRVRTDALGQPLDDVLQCDAPAEMAERGISPRHQRFVRRAAKIGCRLGEFAVHQQERAGLEPRR
jgi:hypothetical protein